MKLQIKNFNIFLSFLLLFTSYFSLFVFPIFAQERANPPGNLGQIEGVGGFLPNLFADVQSNIGIGGVLEKVFTNLLGVFTVIAGLMFLIYFVLGAIGWITAEGDPEKVKKAQKQLTNAVAGLVLVVLAYSVAFVLGEILGLKILNPAEDIKKLGPNQ